MHLKSIALGAYEGAIAATTLMYITQGSLIKGVVFPVTGYLLSRFEGGETARAIGDSILGSSLLIIPGGIAGRVAYSYLGKTTVSKVLATFVGLKVADITAHALLSYSARVLVRGIQWRYLVR